MLFGRDHSQEGLKDKSEAVFPFGWIERGLRQGTKTFFRLDPASTGTAVTIREVWTPVTFRAWLRARLRPKRDVPRRLRRILENLRTALVR